MGKNIVVCCDGTGNQVEGNLSNILKLFRIAEKNATQRVYYHPGIGTIGTRDNWSLVKQNAKAVFGLATGYGLDADILATYRFICEHYQDGDDIFLFGFSRGSYTMRALAGFIHMVGLLPPDQANVAGYALTAYKQSGEDGDFHVAWNFARVMGGRHVSIHFIGCWDTVASVIVPRHDRLLPAMLTLPYTQKNPSVKAFRHAMSIDERRRMFRLNRWKPAQPFVADRFGSDPAGVPQDIRQVWFAGVHCDVGGGYPEDQSGLSKFPLDWMIGEAVTHGLKIDEGMRQHLVFGKPLAGRKNVYVAPDATAQLHDSMNAAWRLLEYIPKSMKWNEWPRKHMFGYYIPDAEPRSLVDQAGRPLIHQSAVERRALGTALPKPYDPVNWPATFEVEPWNPPRADIAAPAQAIVVQPQPQSAMPDRPAVGELFILGFFGKTIPLWLKEFAARYGLGGVILFDYSCQTRQYDNNIDSTEQVRGLCAEIAALPSGPMVFIDQEGGLVRRLKEDRGFQPLPSARDFNHLSPDDKRATLAASFAEMRRLGIHYDFAPVIDVDYNPDNPNIGRIKRSYSAHIGEVEANALLMSEVAREARIGLCLKHFPGIGGAAVDSHQEFMDISDALRPEQEELFYALAPKMFGDAVLVSHAIVRQWDPKNPMTLSAAGLGRLRARLPDTLLITDDMQMQGLQKALGTREACLQSLQAGIDMLCIGNNLLDQERGMAGIADAVSERLREGTLATAAIQASIGRVRARKALLAA